MTTTLWQDDHIYAAPDCPAIDADFQRAAEALTEITTLLAALPETRDINPLRHLLRAKVNSFESGTRVVVRALPPAAAADSVTLGADVDDAVGRARRKAGLS